MTMPAIIYEEYKRCLEILRAKPGGLFGKDNIDEKMRCFEFFKANARPSDMWIFSEFLNNSNSLVRQKAAETIIHLFLMLKSQEELSEGLRSMRITINDLGIFAKTFPEDTYFELLAIASFNGNGYVREEAVALLTKTNNRKAIRYLLLRTADWVSEVREAAIRAIQGCLRPEYHEVFIQQLPVVEWLLQIRRADLSDLYAQIIDFVTSQSLSANGIKALVISDKSRLLLYSHQLERIGLTADLLKLIRDNRNFLIRSLLFKYIPQLPSEEQEKLLSQLLNDRSGRIKLMALYAIKPKLIHFRGRVFALLSDESSAIRELSRSLLKGETTEFAAIYRDNMQNGREILGSLIGLSEVGTKTDIHLFEMNISSTSSKVKLACLTALNRLDSSLGQKYGLSLLTDGSKKVRTRCCEILSKAYDDEVLYQVRSVYESGSSDQRKTILGLFNMIGGWKVVADLIYSLSDPSQEISDMGWGYLLKWKLKAVRTFTTPAPNDLERAHIAYKRIADANLRMTYYRQKLWEELPFFLRR